jgi:hypothetical protein
MREPLPEGGGFFLGSVGYSLNAIHGLGFRLFLQNDVFFHIGIEFCETNVVLE